RPGPAGRGAAFVRADAGLCQPPRPVRRADRQQWRGAGQLPAGVHAPGPDQCRLQPGPDPGGAVSDSAFLCSGGGLTQQQESSPGGFGGQSSRRIAMLTSMRRGIVVAAALALWIGAQAGDEQGKVHDAAKAHVVVRPDDLKWGPAPPGLPAGAKVAVLTGDPSKSMPYVLRALLPDGYKVPPHWHPTDENVTVIKGTLMVGKGEKFSEGDSKALPAGSFARMPRGMRHFAWTKGETIIQVHGVGPFDIIYVNAADDPRKK